MKSWGQVSFFLGLFALAVLTSWKLFFSLENSFKPNELSQDPDSYMYQVVAIRMNEMTGNIQNRLETPYMIHYPLQNHTDILSPKLVVFNDNQESPWYITAQQGKAIEGIEQIQLYQGVTILQPKSLYNTESILRTDHLTVFPNEQYANTDSTATLNQPEGQASSLGLKVYFKTGDIELLSQAKGQYYSAH